MNYPELFRNSKKEHDPDKTNAFHEVGHGLVKVSFGLLPAYTSLIGWEGVLAFNSTSFFACWDIGVDWSKEAPEYFLMCNFAGIIGGAFYSGFYDWAGAKTDMICAEREAKEYGLKYRELLGIWFDTHDLIKEYNDPLEKAAEKLYQDNVIGHEVWEHIFLETNIH